MQFLKLTMILGSFGLIGLATSATLPTTGRDLTATDLPPMKWVIPGKNGENVTLYGDASSVIAQYKSIDADWVPTGLNHSTVEDIPGTLDARQNGLGPTISYENSEGDTCTYCPVGNWGWGGASQGDMQNAQNQLGGNALIFVPANSCVLASAWGNAGIWVCNNQGGQIQLTSDWVHAYATNMPWPCDTCGQSWSAAWDFTVNVIAHHI